MVIRNLAQKLGVAFGAVMLASTVAPVTAGPASADVVVSKESPPTVPPQPRSELSAASACPSRGYHRAMLATVRSSTVSHTCGFVGPAYEGWLGINSQITTPNASANLANTTADHAVGWIGMVNYGAELNWIQIGWYTGGIAGCPIVPNGQYGLYLEWKIPGDSSHCIRLSPLAYGSNVTYRIQHMGNGCWQGYYNYNTAAGGQVCGLPRTMSAQAVNELANGSGNSTTMPRSVFGSASPNTNQALRLMGANGYEPWDTSLLAGGTAVGDERTGSAPHYYVSAYNLYYRTLTYGG
jgi:hypothetical protein